MLWNAISTASGLQGWFADKVTIVHKLCTFQWGEEETRQATILYIQPGCCIRFRWKDEDEPGCFFEMKLTNDELTNDLMLEITDFAEPGEEDEQKELWTCSSKLCGVSTAYEPVRSTVPPSASSSPG